MKSCHQGGMVSIMAIILIMLLLAIGLALSQVTATELTIGESFQSGLAAQYIAESGLQEAIYYLRMNPSWQGIEAPGEPFNEGATAGTLVVTVYHDTARQNFTVVRSIGKVGTAERVVSFAYVSPPGGEEQPIYQYALFAGYQLVVDDPASIMSLRVGSHHQTSVANQVIADCSNQTDIVIPPVPTLDSHLKADKVFANLPVSDGTHTLSLTGRVYFYSNKYNYPYVLTPYQTINGNGVIYSRDTIRIGEFVRIPDRVTIISESSIIIGKNAVLNKALLVARQNIYLEDGVILQGCAIAGNEMRVGKGAQITYDATATYKITTDYWPN